MTARISELTAAAALDGSELLEVSQDDSGLGSRRTTTQDVANLAPDDPQTEPLLLKRETKDAEGLFVTVEWRRIDGTLAVTSELSGGTTPTYDTRTITEYELDGTTVKRTTILDLTYDGDDVLIEETVAP